MRLKKFVCWTLCCGCVLYIIISINNLIEISSWFISEQPNLNSVEHRSNERVTKKTFTRKHWYLANKTTIRTASDVFPGGTITGDRILEQLLYIPTGYNEQNVNEKLILSLPDLLFSSQEGSFVFKDCPVNRCALTGDVGRYKDAAAVIFRDFKWINPKKKKPRNQKWIFLTLESPYQFRLKKSTNYWTATYHHESDLVIPYAKWVYYDPLVTQKDQVVNYAANKTKQVAWFVSNCATENGRLEYAKELAKYINVDIYGECGKLDCPRENESVCFKYLERDYKFYLAFENSNCREYITEKFYENGLRHNVLPIVMGAHPNDYAKSGPKNSYILTDDFASPKDLAVYLHQLDRYDQLYNSYFRWKGTGEFINTYFFCRLCALLHAPSAKKQNVNLNTWWQKESNCTKSSWKNH